MIYYDIIKRKLPGFISYYFNEQECTNCANLLIHVMFFSMFSWNFYRTSCNFCNNLIWTKTAGCYLHAFFFISKAIKPNIKGNFFYVIYESETWVYFMSSDRDDFFGSSIINYMVSIYERENVFYPLKLYRLFNFQSPSTKPESFKLLSIKVV